MRTMNAKMSRRGFVALGATLVLGAAVAGTAIAQQTPLTSWGPGVCPMGFGGRSRANGRAGIGPAAGLQGPAHEAVASTLGISSDELFTAMRSGKTVAQLAQEKGVDLDAVVAAALKAHDETLDARVQAGRLTQSQADWMDSHMETNVRAMFAGQFGAGMMGGPDFGPAMGSGMGPGRHGPGMAPGFGPR